MTQPAFREIPRLFFDFIMKAESCNLVGYADGAGVPTNGWGHTGSEVRVGLSISLDVAKINLGSDAGIARRRAYQVMDEPTILAMSEHQWAAILSFIFNCGGDPKDAIWAVLKTRQWSAVPSKLMNYTHEHKNGVLVEVPGLVNRRTAEVTLWNAPDADAAAAVVLAAPVAPPPSSYTRDATTPPVVADASPAKKHSLTAIIGAAVLGAPKLVSQLSDGVSSTTHLISPFSDRSPLVASSIATLATAGAALAVIGGVVLWIAHRQERHG